MKTTKYLIDEATIDEIFDLCQSLVSKTIRLTQIITEEMIFDPLVKRYKYEKKENLTDFDEIF